MKQSLLEIPLAGLKRGQLLDVKVMGLKGLGFRG